MDSELPSSEILGICFWEVMVWHSFPWGPLYGATGVTGHRAVGAVPRSQVVSIGLAGLAGLAGWFFGSGLARFSYAFGLISAGFRLAWA